MCVIRVGMSNVTNASSDVDPNNATLQTTPSYPPCSGTFNPFDCSDGTIVDEDQFLAIVILSLAIIACALCVVACILTVLVHKLSSIWLKALIRPTAAETEASEARKGLLQDTKSSFATASSKAEGKKKKASFAEDTSCAPPRDVDEEDL